MTKLLRKDIYFFVFSIIIYPSGLSSFVGGYEITPAKTQILQIEERVDHPIYYDGKDVSITREYFGELECFKHYNTSTSSMCVNFNVSL